MSTFTENYNLIKPGEQDFYDIQDFNENMDTIDAQMMQAETELNGIGEKIGTPENEGDTVFSLLNQKNTIPQVVKSIQHVTFTPSLTTNTNASVSIDTVDPARCVVLFERLYNADGEIYSVKYTLAENAINIKYDSVKGGFTAGFWVVEFY